MKTQLLTTLILLASVCSQAQQECEKCLVLRMNESYQRDRAVTRAKDYPYKVELWYNLDRNNNVFLNISIYDTVSKQTVSPFISEGEYMTFHMDNGTNLDVSNMLISKDIVKIPVKDPNTPFATGKLTSFSWSKAVATNANNNQSLTGQSQLAGVVYGDYIRATVTEQDAQNLRQSVSCLLRLKYRNE